MTDAIPGQLSFAIDSAGASDTIYVTADASVNDIVIHVGANVTATLTPAAEVVDQSLAPTVTGTLLYLDLTPLQLSDAEFAGIAPTDANWHFGKFPSERVVGMTPNADLTVDPALPATISIGPLADAEATGASASLNVNVYRVGGVTLGNLPFPTSFSVALATPPIGGDDLKQDLLVALATPDVVNTVPGYDPFVNQLSFAFYAGPRGRPVTPSPGAQFNLSFVYSTDPSGYGALCTPDQVKYPFEIVKSVNAGDWEIASNRSQQSPSWTLTPPAGQPVVGTGPVSTVGIVADHLITTFQPGPTVALIHYSGFDGYADGVFTLPIYKHAHVRIDSLTIEPNPAILKDGSAEVTVTWAVANAGTMTLAPFERNVTHHKSARVQITENTPISLTADGTVLANAGNTAIFNATARILPVINSFEAVPRAVYAGELPRPVDLSWNVNTNEQLQLISSTQQPDPNLYNHIGAVTKVINGPQMLTLVPLGQAQVETVERSIVLSAFTPQVGAWPVSARALAAPPDASFVVASDGLGSVTAVDTMVYAPVSAPIMAGKQPGGLAFSPDGGTLYVANAGDKTISTFRVAATGAVPQYTFTLEATTPVLGAPQQLAVSPDGAYLYATLDGGTSGNSYLGVLTAANKPEVVTNIPVGLAPKGVAVMASCARIYVANAGSSTVTAVGRAPDGHHTVATTIPDLPSAEDVAITPDGNVLLVTCPANNAVVAVNATYPLAPRKTLTVGASPQQIALVPHGGYAVVTCADAGTVELLSVGPMPQACKVLKADIEVGVGARAIAVTPDAGLVLAGTTAGLSAVTLGEYATAQDPPAVGKSATDVAIAPDGKTAVAWHDARKWDWPGPPDLGLFVYDVPSETVRPQLTTTEVVGVVYHPSASAKTAFLIDKSDARVSLMSTDDWSVRTTIDLSGRTTGLPVELATSSDGETLFVLALDSKSFKCDLLVYEADGSSATWVLKGMVDVLTSTQGSGLTLAAAPHGSCAYVTDAISGHLLIAARGDDGSWALKGAPLSVGTMPLATALSPDGATLYVNGVGKTSGSLAKVDTTTGAVTSVALPSSSLTQLAGLAVSPDGNRLFATDQIAAGVRVFDTASLRVLQTISWESGVQAPSGIAITADAASIYTANTNSANLGIVSQVQAGAAPHAAAHAAPQLGAPAYQGLFIRDYVGQTPQTGNHTGAWSNCPDIWASGEKPLDNAKSTLVDGYGNNSPSVIYVAGKGVNNYIYVRGLNATNGANTSRVWLYYVNGGGDASLMLWPPSWLNQGMSALQTGDGYIEVASSALNEVDYTYPPFVWDAVPVDGHYCIVAWVENPPLSQPPTDPRPSIGSIGSYDQLGQFIMDHPNMGWRNTTEVPTTSGETWSMQLPLQGPQTGGPWRAGLQFTKMPTDASFAFSIVGPESCGPEGSVNVGKTPITNPNQTYLTPLDWTNATPNYQTNLSVTYYAGTQQMQQGAKITVTAGMNLSALVGLVADPLAGAIRADVYPTGDVDGGFRQEWLTLVGTVELHLVPPS